MTAGDAQLWDNGRELRRDSLRSMNRILYNKIDPGRDQRRYASYDNGRYALLAQRLHLVPRQQERQIYEPRWGSKTGNIWRRRPRLVRAA